MRKSFAPWMLSWVAVALIAGCAHPQLIDMGEAESVVETKLGAPNAKTAMPDGTTRWTYSSQPFGQEVWWLFVKDGKVISREQGLQEKYFPMVKIGISTEKDVWALWGTYAEKYEFRLCDEHAWMYRFKDSGHFDMAVWPQFDKTGVVRSMDVTEDPWRARERLFSFF